MMSFSFFLLSLLKLIFMTKREIYEGAISIQKKSGQGLSGIVGQASFEVQELLDELVEEGSLKLVRNRNNYLPDDIWYFPTTGYCVFEDFSDKRTLGFVRMFLGDTEIFLNFPYTTFIQDPDYMKAYSDWLIKNKEQLDIMINLDEEYKGEDVLFTDKEIEDIKSREWFTDNKSVKDCLQESRNRVKELEEMISLNGRIITLYKQKGNSEKEIEECEKSIEDTKKQIKFRKRLHNYLDSLDQKKPIQEQFTL